jgi:HD-like signal output (HDOD) protein
LSPPLTRRSSAGAAEGDPQRRAETLHTLLQRIRAEPDFPTLKESIQSIQRISRSDHTHLRALTDHVMRDTALAGKVLRLINAAFYGQAGAGSIDSIARAIALLGLQTVAMLAASLMLFEQLPLGVDRERVRELMSRALLSALIARELCEREALYEKAYLTALFLDLGPLLLAIHLPEAGAEVDARLEQAIDEEGIDIAGPAAHERLARLSRQLLGLTHEELGIEVAAEWGWPEDLQAQMRRLYPARSDRAVPDEDYLRVLCTGAADLAARLHAVDEAGAHERTAPDGPTLQGFGAAFARPLGLDPQTLQARTHRALSNWRSLGELLVPRDRRRHRAHRGSTPAGAAAGKPAALDAEQDRRLSDALSSALARASRLALSEDPLQAVLQDVADELVRALGVQRVVVCLRDARGALLGKVGAGRAAQAACAAFHVPLGRSTDLFSVLCAQGKDTLISDATERVIADRLPDWFAARVGAATFLVLPLLAGPRVAGMIYADRQEPRSIVLGPRHLHLLEALRNQVLVAIRLRTAGG